MASLSSPIGPTIDVVARTISRSVISGGVGRGGALTIQPQVSLVNLERNLEVQTTENAQQTQDIFALSNRVNNLKTEVENLKKGSALTIQPQASLVNVERNLEVQTTENAQQTQEISALSGTVNNLKSEVESVKKGSALVVQPQANLVNVERNLEIQSNTVNNLKSEVESVKKGGALAIQPQASLVNVERNIEIQTVQNVQQTQEISALRSTVDALRIETATLNNGLGTVSNLIQQDSALEKQQEAAKAENERKLLERNIRLGKESQLEQNITNALAKPVQALQKKVGNIFGRIGEALTVLFAGWLTNQGIEALKAESDGNKNKLEEIKDNVLKHIGYAIGAFAAIKIGFDLIIKTITGLAGKIGRLVLKLATAPLNLIRKGLQAVPFIGPLFGGPKPDGPKPGPKPPGGGGMGGGARNFVRGLGIPALTGSVLTALDIAQGEDPGRAIAGAATGMIGSGLAFAGGSIIPIPGSGVVTGALAYGPSADFGKGLYDKFFGKSETPAAKVSPTTPKVGDSKPEPPPTIIAPAEVDAKISSSTVEPQNSMMSDSGASSSATTTAPPAAVQPQTPAIPPPSPEMTKQFQMAWDNRNRGYARGRIESAWNNMTYEQQQQAKMWAKSTGKEWTEMKLVEKPPTVQAVPLPSAQVQPLPKPTQNVGELPEPAPNVVMMPSGQGNNQQSSISQAPTNGTDTPLISSSNPDNFYVLYSQLNYNVVI